MSKSIKQYKDAMDSIRISDSFARRTEQLLKETEASESVRISGGRNSRIRNISAAAGVGLAACIAAVIMLRQQTAEPVPIMSGDAGITAVTSVTDVTVAGEEAVFVAIEEDKDEYVLEDDPALEILESYYPDEDETAANADKNENTASHAEAAPASAQLEEGRRAEEESPAPAGGLVHGDAAEDLAGGNTGAVSADDTEAEPETEVSHIITPDIFEDDAAEDDSGSGSAPSGGAGLYYIDYSRANAELIYYSGGKTQSLILDGVTAKEVVSDTAHAVYGSEETSGGAGTDYEYAVVITDSKTGSGMYTIYITLSGKIIMTDSTSGEKVTSVYIPDKKEFAELRSTFAHYFL